MFRIKKTAGVSLLGGIIFSFFLFSSISALNSSKKNLQIGKAEKEICTYEGKDKKTEFYIMVLN